MEKLAHVKGDTLMRDFATVLAVAASVAVVDYVETKYSVGDATFAFDTAA